MNKILTVVIPTYNMEKYLRRCLDSLIIDDKELFDSLEVLVINDGSKDSSSAIAHEYQDKYPNVFRVIDKENGNYGSCVNRGIKEATGKYIKILDADDYFSSPDFKVYLEQLLNLQADMILTDFSLVDSTNKTITECTCDLSIRKLMRFKDVYTSNFMKNIEMHAITYLKENLQKIGYKQTEGISYTDQEWSFCPMSEVKIVYYFPCNLYQYFIGRQGQTVDPKVFYKSISQNFMVMKSTIDYYYEVKEKLSEEHKEYLYNRLCDRIKILYRNYIADQLSHGLEIPEFKDFDLFLKSNLTTFYIESGDYCRLDKWLPYKFLKEWRKNGNSLFFKFMFFIYNGIETYRKIRNKL